MHRAARETRVALNLRTSHLMSNLPNVLENLGHAKQAGLDATTWTANAAKDAAHWIANTASNAGRTIARVFNPSHW